MTVIAVRGNQMAADSRGSYNSGPYTCEKIYRARGLIVGMAGEASACLAFVEYFKGKPVPDDELKGAVALVLAPKGIWLYDESHRGDQIEEEFFAIGAGGPIALGAMELGATAEQAVAAACRWNTDCGLPVVSMKLRRTNVKRRT